MGSDFKVTTSPFLMSGVFAFRQVTWYKALHGLLDSFTYVISCFIFTSALKRKQSSSDCIHFTDEGTKALKFQRWAVDQKKIKLELST